jgi:[ribosomal protein S18]-alanine N-acetyltransferase
MQLRSFRPSDLDTLHEIDHACFPPAISYSRDDLASFINQDRSETWIAEQDGRIAGFLVADRQPPRAGHIITLDVVLACRRQGIGTLLMDAAEEWVRKQGLQLVYLETGADNVTAQRFYVRRGYERYRIIDSYYANGDAAWVMVKWLETAVSTGLRAPAAGPSAGRRGGRLL